MAKMKKFLAAFQNARSRTLIIVVLILVLIALGIGYWFLRSAKIPTGAKSGAQLATVPVIQSIPGERPASPEYTKAQQLENIQQAQKAAREGTSAIATITGSSYLGASEFGQTQAATTETSSMTGGASGQSKEDCGLEQLARSRQAGVNAYELKCKNCGANQLRGAGFTAGELMNAGYGVPALKSAGFTPSELRTAGFTAPELTRAGFTPSELIAAGYSAADLAQSGVSAQQLIAADLTTDQLQAAGVGATPSNMPKDCSEQALKQARAQGISAGQLRKIGCNTNALKAANYNAAELKAAGFNAAELKKAGFGANELKDAGFSAGELKRADYSTEELLAQGYSPNDLRDAGFTAAQLKKAGVSANQLIAAGYTSGELVRAGFTPPQAAVTTPPPSQAAATTPPAATLSPKTTAVSLAPQTNLASETAQQPSPSFSSVASVADEDVAATAALEKIQKRQEEQLSQQERQEVLTQLQQAMQSQATDLFSKWTPPAKQEVVIGPVDDKAEKTAAAQAASAASAKTQALSNPVFVKAGTVMFGVLDTGINSDEQSPILATIVQGPLKGAKLMGTFTRVDKKVVLNFTTMGLSQLPNSLSINAVAIDPNTARTAMADNVDNHYFLRYGTLFASSFLSGLGTAIAESGSTTSFSIAGFSETNASFSPGEEALIGLGQVGKTYASVMGSNFQTPPTVTVDSGAGIGILFMADATIPIPGQPQPSATSAATTPQQAPAPQSAQMKAQSPGQLQAAAAALQKISAPEKTPTQ